MHDRAIAKLSLIMAVVGILGLFLVNLLIVPTFLTTAEIDSSRTGQIISVDADIKQFSVSDGHIFMTLIDGSGEIRAVMWQSSARGTEAYNLSVGDAVLVTGQVTNYRGELEIVVSKLER